jgi:hypothetical protein
VATDAAKDAGKARDADPKRQADQRKADRRQQWTERQKYDQQREQELRDAQARMQDDDAPRDVVIRRDWHDDRRDYRDDSTGPPVRMGFPPFNLFGPD